MARPFLFRQDSYESKSILLFTDRYGSVAEVVLVTSGSEEVDALAQSIAHLVLYHPLAIDGRG